MQKYLLSKYGQRAALIGVVLFPFMMLAYVQYVSRLASVAAVLLVSTIGIMGGIVVYGYRKMPSDYKDAAKIMGVRRTDYVRHISLPWLRRYLMLAFLSISIVGWYTVLIMRIVSDKPNATSPIIGLVVLGLNVLAWYVMSLNAGREDRESRYID